MCMSMVGERARGVEEGQDRVHDTGVYILPIYIHTQYTTYVYTYIHLSSPLFH